MPIGTPVDIGQAVAYVVAAREVGSGAPARGLDKARAARCYRNDGDLVAVVVECGFKQHVGRQRAGQLDDRAVGRVAEVGADGRIVVALPLRSGLVLSHRVMDEVAEELPLVVDVVIDAEQFFTDRDRADGRRSECSVSSLVGCRGKILGGVEEQAFGSSRLAGIVLFGKGLAGSQTSRRQAWR